MKTLFKLSVLVLAGSLLLSCVSSPNRLSSGEIVRQYNKMMKKAATNEYFVDLEVGKYEENSSAERLILRQLEAAGIVTYEVARYPWWEKTFRTYRKAVPVTKYYWGYAYQDEEYRTVKENVYNFEDHYIVGVGLTRKGKSLVVEERPEPVYETDKDLADPEIDPDKYAWNKKDLTENWPEIENPFIQKEEPAAPAQKPAAPAQAEDRPATPSTPADEPEEDPTERIDARKYEAYNALDLNSEDVILKAFSVKAVKARNIQISTASGTPKATAEVILTSYGTTDAGRILEGAENGFHQLATVTLTYYQDKGWVLDEID